MYCNSKSTKIFSLKIIDSRTGIPFSPEDIYFNLKELVASSKENCSGLGILTAENRNVWYECYAKLTQSNKKKNIFT